MTEPLTEENLLAECEKGSREAFARLYELHQRRVFSVALNFFGGERAPAEDVTQQVFLKLFAKIGSFRGEAEFTTWVYRLTVNACIDERRRTRRFFALDELLLGGRRAKRTPADGLERRETADEVQKAIGALKEKYRLPIVLKYSEGLSYEEIARVLECSAGTVASRLSRGHRQLAQRLRHLKGAV